MKQIVLFSLLLAVSVPLKVVSQNFGFEEEQSKIALVIGNGMYRTSILANPENDARDMEAALKDLGFEVYKYENLDQKQMKKAIDDFGMRLRDYDVGLFFYAGHGIQSDGFNYLIPVDASLMTEKQVEYDCVKADRVLALMEGSGAPVNIMILDACRDNPFERSWERSTRGKGLAFMNAPKGTLIGYATSPGSTASDGSGRNGLYTSAILECIMIPDITIIQMFQEVRRLVSQKSHDRQTPWESTSLTGDFYFNRTIPIHAGEVTDNSRFAMDISDHSSQAKDVTDDSYLTSEVPDNSYGANRNSLIFRDPRDNQQYRIVRIGEQVWMAENLNYETEKGSWIYDNEASNAGTYGRLYNWKTACNVCPSGWHLPSDAEWEQLELYLDPSQIDASALEFTTSIEGCRLAGNADLWQDGLLKKNKAFGNAGFAALPGGRRSIGGSFSYLSKTAYFWSATEYNSSSAWYFRLRHDITETNLGSLSKDYGFSVRCIKD